MTMNIMVASAVILPGVIRVRSHGVNLYYRKVEFAISNATKSNSLFPNLPNHEHIKND